MIAQRIYKEARPLFWPWCAVALTAVLPLVYSWRLVGGAIPLGFIFGIALLANLAFGSEFHHRTFSLLLSQPVSRMEIWREKLGVTLGVALSAFLIFIWATWPVSFRLEDLLALAGPGAWLVATIASATFWTLFTGSTLGGLILSFTGQSVVVFAASIAQWRLRLALGVAVNAQPRAPRIPNFAFLLANINLGVVPIIALLGYSGVMLWLGWRKLARFQATGAAAGDDLLIAGPDIMQGVLAGWLRCRPTGVVFNLIRKEIRLLRPVWLLTILAAAGWTCVTLVWLLHHGRTIMTFQITVVSLGVTCTLLIPILAGSLSLGEERTSGAHAWHLTLPVSALLQWGVKLCVALFAGFVGAWLFPALITSPFLFMSSNLWVGGHVVLITVLFLTFAAFWSACAVNGTVRAVLWVFPVVIALYLAWEFGRWAGPALTAFFLSRFDPFANVKFADAVSRFGSSALFRLIDAGSGSGPFGVQLRFVLPTTIFVPTLLYAVIQSYRLFRAQIQDRTLSVVRSLLPLALTAFLCSFSLFSLNNFVFRAQQPKSTVLFETMRAIQKLQLGALKLDAAHPLQLTVEDLAKASPLSKSTRRLLGDSPITLRLDEPPHQGHFGCAENLEPRGPAAMRYSWYSAMVPLADGSRFFVNFEPGAHSFTSAGFCK